MTAHSSLALARHPGARCDQSVETINRLGGRPGDPAKQQDSKQRIVKSPTVVHRNTDEDPPAEMFGGPHLCRCRTVLVSGRQKCDRPRINTQFPIDIVLQLQPIKVANDRMVLVVNL